MKTFNALLLAVIWTIGMLSWSNLEAQVAPTGKTTITKSTKSVKPYQNKAASNEIVAPSNITNTASKKKKPKPKPKPSLGGMADGSVHFKLPTDGTSNTSQNSTNAESKKKKPKPKPSFGGISDGSSNTIMYGESSSGKKTSEPVKSKVNQPAKAVKGKK